MTRPQIVRADTLDLQDQIAPSAQDHTRQPTQPAPLGIGPAAPHQAAAVRHIAEERAEEDQNLQEAWNIAGSTTHEPETDDNTTTHVEHTNGEDTYGQEQHATEQNGGLSGTEETDTTEAEGESSGEDDMLDRISSSPSIDDGGYFSPSPSAWPRRISSLQGSSTADSTPVRQSHATSQASSVDSSPFVITPNHLPVSFPIDQQDTPSSAQANSSSPYTVTPPYFPLFRRAEQEQSTTSEDHHLDGEYIRTMDDHEAYDHYGAWETEHIEVLSPVVGAPQGRSVLDLTQLPQNRISDIEDDTDDDDLHALLLPTDDPLLNNSFDDTPPSPTGSSDPYTSGSDGEHSSEDYDTKDDDTNDISFSNDSRFIDSGWGGECLRETEDIDFEFVYALHTFVATVEGQANATKGDTMVLLDDSNSYWWLVRIVKDSSIGYLPAEHIETPTERLARLNKHRNIDLSATMLGDNPEKSKNPLKKAIRRRHAKTAQFTAPTYVEASDYEYSSDEEEAINGEPVVNGAARPADASQSQGIDAENATAAEQADAAQIMNGVGPEGEDRPGSGLEAGDEAVVNKHDHLEGISDVQPEGAALKSRNGMLRNTDSFFKDDTVETRKITLTPNLLRDDSSASTTRSSDAKERSSSLDSLEKSTSPPDKYKDDKRRKEKKPGMLSGLFKSKKKDKKGKLIDDDTTEAEKVTGETSSRGSPLLGRSGETSPVDRPATSVLPQGQQPPHRQTSKNKLQKTPPDIKIPPRDRAADVASDAMSPTLQSPVVEKQSAAIAAVATIEGQDAGVSAPQRAPPMKPALRLRSPTEPQHVVTNLERPEGQSRKEHNGPLSPLTNMLRSDREPRPEKVKKAKQRVQLDDFDSPQDGDKSADPFADPNEAYDSLYQDDESHAPAAKELSESPFEILSPVSPLTEAEANSIPALVRDTSSHSDQDDELVSPSSTPSLLEADAASATTTTTTTAPTTPHATVEPPHTAKSPLPSTRIETPTHPSPRPSSASPTSLRTPLHLTPTPTWSDTRLRAFLDGDNDIRDMLLLVHDRSGAVPVGADHPLAKGLFGAERERLAEMEGVLDRLLEGVLDRGRGRGAVGT